MVPVRLGSREFFPGRLKFFAEMYRDKGVNFWPEKTGFDEWWCLSPLGEDNAIVLSCGRLLENGHFRPFQMLGRLKGSNTGRKTCNRLELEVEAH